MRHEGYSGRGGARRPTRWALWSQPRRVLVFVLSVEALAVGLLVAAPEPDRVPEPGLWIPAALVCAGLAHAEIALGVERTRRRAREDPHIDLGSVWTFAAAVLLRPAVAAAVVGVLYLHRYVRVWRPARVPAHRAVFTVATVLLAVHAAGGVVGGLFGGPRLGTDAGLAAVLAAMPAYTLVNAGLVAAVLVLGRPGRPVAQVLGPADDVVLELATLCMGALVAVAVASASPAHALLVLLPLVVLHRAVLVRQLRRAASTDSKTGLLNAGAWRTQAADALRRAERTAGGAAVLIVDIDHFKKLNDDHGHLAGDHVLSQVAAALRTEVREADLVGRFGGEEFVVLLAGLTAGPGRDELRTVAERIRRRIDALRVECRTSDGARTVEDVSVSVGGAIFPGDGTDLDALLAVADAALYAAKRAGRNAVRMGPQVPPPDGPGTAAD